LTCITAQVDLCVTWLTGNYTSPLSIGLSASTFTLHRAQFTDISALV